VTDETSLIPRKISIIYDHVQVGRALNWPAAREALRESIYDMLGPRVTGIGSVADARERHLARAAALPSRKLPPARAGSGLSTPAARCGALRRATTA